MMRWFRSWPAELPYPPRAHVADSLPKLVMRDHDYRTVGPWPDDEPGLCLLEWDVALDRVGRDRFVEVALAEPERVVVAPYPIFPVGQPPVCVHRIGGRAIPDEAPECETFGLGCVYLPRAVVARFLDEAEGPMRDIVFSRWHNATVGRARVCWDVHPQHLHGD